jgi:hypothetical protein
MTANLTPTDAYPANLLVAADGDAVSQTLRTTVMQTYANAINHLKNRTPGALGGNILIPTSAFGNKNARFTQSFTGDQPTWEQTNIADQGALWFPIPHIFGAEITGLVATLHGDGAGGGPHVGLPANVPELSLFGMESTTGVSTNHGTQADTSAGIGAYDAIHTITLTTAAQTFDNTELFYARFEGESGANSIANALELYTIYAVIQSV